MRVVRLGQAAQKHYRSGDVLIGLSELWGIILPVHGVVLDPTGVTPGIACWSTCTGRSVVRRVRWRSRWLVQPLLSWFLAVLPCELGGLRMRIRRGVSLQGLCYRRWLSRSIRHSALSGRTVARCHVADARAVTLNIVIHEVKEIGRSIARHPHEFGHERGRRRHPSEPPGVCVRGRCEAIGEPVVWRSQWGQQGPSR